MFAACSYIDRPLPALARTPALWVICLALLVNPHTAAAQANEVQSSAVANFDLAARWAPYKIRKMVHSTTVAPRWIEGSEKFWYEWENADGTFFYIVDPERGTRNQLFDNDVMAAELTRITRDPWDGQHLPITNIRFISDDTFQFDVESSQDEAAEDTGDEEDDEEQQEEGDRARERSDKRVHHFEFTVSTQMLRLLQDYEEPNDHPAWASVSPDGQTVVFVRDYNLWMMSGADYQQILDARRGQDGDEAEEAENEVDVDEVQLTIDGEEYYSYVEREWPGRNQCLPRGKQERSQTSQSYLVPGLRALCTGAYGLSRGREALGGPHDRE